MIVCLGEDKQTRIASPECVSLQEYRKNNEHNQTQCVAFKIISDFMELNVSGIDEMVSHCSYMGETRLVSTGFRECIRHKK